MIILKNSAEPQVNSKIMLILDKLVIAFILNYDGNKEGGI